MFMKSIFALLLLLLLVHPAFAQLTPDDIRIIREEVTKIVKAEIDVSETRMREYIDLKFDVQDTKFTSQDTKFTTEFEGLSRQLTIVVILVSGLIALIVVAIDIPQIIIARKQKGHEALEAEIRTLREKVELLEQTRLIGPN